MEGALHAVMGHWRNQQSEADWFCNLVAGIGRFAYGRPVIIRVDESGDFSVGTRALFVGVYLRPSERAQIVEDFKVWERDVRRARSLKNELKGYSVTDEWAYVLIHDVLANESHYPVRYLAFGVDVKEANFAAMAVQREIFLEGYERWAATARQSGNVDAARGVEEQGTWVRKRSDVQPLKLVMLGTASPDCIEWAMPQAIERGLLARGGAIAFIASSAGLGWESHFMEISALLDIDGFDEAAQWLRDRNRADYMSTKLAICAFVARDALRFLQHGIRINALCPGPTDTPLARSETWLAGGSDYRETAGVEASTPMDQACPLVFLCSDAARSVAGITLVSDHAWFSSGITGSFPPATGIASFLYGRPAAHQAAREH